jgi:lipopolysaccharide exporter
MAPLALEWRVSPPVAGGQLSDKMRRGAAWTTLDVALGRFGQFAQGVVIARILAPSDFGVFAVALVIHTIVINVSDLGVAAALIRDDPEQSERAAPTVVTMALGAGCVLGLLMALSSGLAASLLGSPKAAGAIAVMALTLPLAGLTAVPTAFLRRHFRMDRIFWADMANTLVSGVLVIALALAGWGAMALAWSWVAGQLLTTIVLLTYRPGRFGPGWERSEVRRLLAFGLPLAGANIIAFSVLNVDYVIVGKLLGATALGLYVLAFNISGWPMNVFGAVVRSVSLPGFAQLQRDGGDMPDRFAAALRLVATVTLPICFILGAVGRPLVVTVYGQRWGLAATALVGLCVLGAGRILLELSGDFLVTLGRTRAVFIAQIPWLIGLIVALLIGVHGHGIAGAGAAQAIVVVGLMLPLYMFFLNRAGVRPTAVLRALGPPAAWAAIAAGLAWVVSQQFADPALACMTGAAAGLVLYVLPHLRTIRTSARQALASRAERKGQPDDELVELEPTIGVGPTAVDDADLAPTGIGVHNVEFATQRELL